MLYYFLATSTSFSLLTLPGLTTGKGREGVKGRICHPPPVSLRMSVICYQGLSPSLTFNHLSARANNQINKMSCLVWGSLPLNEAELYHHHLVYIRWSKKNIRGSKIRLCRSGHGLISQPASNKQKTNDLFWLYFVIVRQQIISVKICVLKLDNQSKQQELFVGLLSVALVIVTV